MQSFSILRKHKPEKTFKVSSIIGTYDLQSDTITEQFTGQIDLDWDWKIGLICGNSGTGKTTIARELFKDAYFNGFNYGNNAIIDDMNGESIEEICMMFNSVGFSSPPCWIKPYHVLSNGQKMRVDLANALLSDKPLIVFDEFTSVVDRNIAKIGSFAVQKSIRRTDKKFIAVSCHEDIKDWLLPDWILNTNSMQFIKQGKKKDLKSSLKYSKQQINLSGKCLASIII